MHVVKAPWLLAFVWSSMIRKLKSQKYLTWFLKKGMKMGFFSKAFRILSSFSFPFIWLRSTCLYIFSVGGKKWSPSYVFTVLLDVWKCMNQPAITWKYELKAYRKWDSFGCFKIIRVNSSARNLWGCTSSKHPVVGVCSILRIRKLKSLAMLGRIW